MKEIIVQKGQSIIDICIEHYGTPNAMLQLHELNDFDMIPQILEAGDVVKVDPDNSDHTNKKQLRAMQGASVASYQYDIEVGIGEMKIGSTFIVK